MAHAAGASAGHQAEAVELRRIFLYNNGRQRGVCAGLDAVQGEKDMEERQGLRQRYIRARESLTPEERAEKSSRAVERIAELPEFRQASVVMIYRAVRGEMTLEQLPGHPAARGKRFAYPRCAGPGTMQAMIPGGWKEGFRGIPEPDPVCSEEVAPEEIDLVICPGAAFDRECTRLGMGGGYYDRFLPRCGKAAVILAAFEAQRADRLPREQWDIPMDRVVTEERIYTGRRGEDECG